MRDEESRTRQKLLSCFQIIPSQGEISFQLKKTYRRTLYITLHIPKAWRIDSKSMFNVNDLLCLRWFILNPFVQNDRIRMLVFLKSWFETYFLRGTKRSMACTKIVSYRPTSQYVDFLQVLKFTSQKCMNLPCQIIICCTQMDSKWCIHTAYTKLRTQDNEIMETRQVCILSVYILILLFQLRV